MADNSYWFYNYDSLGQVINGHKYFSDQAPVAGQQFDYAFDNIGNRTQTLAGGDQNGGSQRSAAYTPNNLNQYTQRTAPGFADLMGVSFATNTVTVGGQTAYRKGEYFRNQLPVSNVSSAVWTNIVVSATGQNSVTGNVFIAQTPEYFSYDADGNLTQDGRWTYSWDAENRLTNLTSLSSAATGSKLKLDFLYDTRGRRIQKLVSTNNGSAYYPQSTNRFVYDGWNLIAVLNPQSAVVRSFMWGLDLSGSPQGAGGVGGLLEINDAINGVQFAAFDGNGNVAGLVKGTDGTTSGQYEYGPFGEVIRATGPMAKANPFRFSTKYQDDETDLLYYGYRYYNASTGRWNSRDPLEEAGGLNLYLFAENAPIGKVDSNGREITETGSGGGATGGVIRTRKTAGEPVKGLVVGTFQYPRRGYCGCWKRNVYSDFTPILTQHLQHYKYWTSYKDDFSLDADMLEALAELAHFLEPIGPDPAALGLAVESGWQRRLDTVNFTVTKEYNAWDFGDISWSMGKTYYKNGQSTKISTITCKPRLDMLDAAGIKALTDGLGARFGKLPGFGVDGPVTTTTTVN